MNTVPLLPVSNPSGRPFYPVFDSLRAIAFLMVFLVHYRDLFSHAAFLKWGWVGVDLFFVLSGFLITGILYDSAGSSNYFRSFYARRALRIFPLIYLLLLTLLLLTPLLHLAWNRFNLTSYLYLSNFLIPGFLSGHHADPGIVNFTIPFHSRQHALVFEHFWSLCVEEQFYLLWPAVIWLVQSRRTLFQICLAIVTVMPLLRTVAFRYDPAFSNHAGIAYSGFFRMDTLVMGAALALWLRGNPIPVIQVRRVTRGVLFGAPILFIICFMCERSHSSEVYCDPVVTTIGFSLIGITATAIVLLAADPNSSLSRGLLRCRLGGLGRISYGMYIFHLIPIMAFYSLAEVLKPYHLGFLAPAFAFAYTYVAATLSFRFIESPFLKFKAQFALKNRSPDTTIDRTNASGRQRLAYVFSRLYTRSTA